MCGIVGIIGNEPAAQRVYNSLKTLEYRGYDSAGIASISPAGLDKRKAVGKLKELGKLLESEPLKGNLAIGHTRWATHGAANLQNSHPHIYENVAIVHNGIIENYAEIKSELIEKNYQFQSDTDSEVIAVLIYENLKSHDFADAFSQTLRRLTGAFSVAAIIEGHEVMLVARRGAPLAVGYGEGENYIGSDSIALSQFTQNITYLNDGDWAILTKEHVQIFDALDNAVEREVKKVEMRELIVDKGRHKHFMIKEIHDQPAVLSYTMSHYLSSDRKNLLFSELLDLDFLQYQRVTLIACGTAYYACLTAKYWLEALARIPAEVEIASEFRYREPPLGENDLVIFVSQSGETADTLAALEYAHAAGAMTIALVNSEESSIARAAHKVLPLKAGVEMSVASTKAFTAQLCVLFMLSVDIAQGRQQISQNEFAQYLEDMISIPRIMNEILDNISEFQSLAHKIARAHNVLFLGRGNLYPLALEAALKLQEITYIHSAGYAAGELKHGPIALIDEELPVIVFSPSDFLLEKTISNIKEVAARGGDLLIIGDETARSHMDLERASFTKIPKVTDHLLPFIYAIPAQLLAYFTALEKGTDIDQPRNLAKSVTVE